MPEEGDAHTWDKHGRLPGNRVTWLPGAYFATAISSSNYFKTALAASSSPASNQVALTGTSSFDLVATFKTWPTPDCQLRAGSWCVALTQLQQLLRPSRRR